MNNTPLEVAHYLVEQYPDSLKVENNSKRLPLHDACSQNASIELVQFLVKKHPGSTRAVGKDGWLPLHHACSANASLAMLKYLVRQYPEAMDALDLHYQTPLMLVRHADLHQWMARLTVRWIWQMEHILLRTLMDQGRASLETNHLSVCHEEASKTQSELDLLEFVFATSPEGVFATILSYL